MTNIMIVFTHAKDLPLNEVQTRYWLGLSNVEAIYLVVEEKDEEEFQKLKQDRVHIWTTNVGRNKNLNGKDWIKCQWETFIKVSNRHPNSYIWKVDSDTLVRSVALKDSEFMGSRWMNQSLYGCAYRMNPKFIQRLCVLWHLGQPILDDRTPEDVFMGDCIDLYIVDGDIKWYEPYGAKSYTDKKGWTISKDSYILAVEEETIVPPDVAVLNFGNKRHETSVQTLVERMKVYGTSI